MKTGLAIHTITPDGPVRMVGYGDRTHPSEGVRDDLLCSVLYFEPEGGSEAPFALVELDLCIMGPAAVEAVQNRVAAATGLASERVVLHFSHTHSGPDTIAIHEDPEPWAQRYYVLLTDAIIAATREARDGAFRGSIEVRTGRCHMAVNRRHLVDPIDSQLTLFSILDARRQPRAILFHYACHPTAFGVEHYRISADWVGDARRAVSEFTGLPVVFVQGAQGNLDPVCRGVLDMADPDQARGSTDRTVVTTAHVLVNAIRDTLNEPVRVEVDAAALVVRDVTIPLRYTGLSSTEVDRRIHAWKQEFAEFLGCPVEDVPEGPTINSLIKDRAREIGASRDETIRMVAEQFVYTTFLWMYRGAESHIRAEEGTATVRITRIDLGPVRLLGIPAEPLVEIALDFRQRHPDRLALVAGLCGGWTGYLPHRSNFEQEDAGILYETISTLYAPEAASTILDEVGGDG
jgi:hypothetical protein